MKLRRLMVPAGLSLMILLLACPPVQAYSGLFYVIPTSAPLRECASPQCAVLLTVYQGAKVEILERTATGWSKVRLVDRAAMGWMLFVVVLACTMGVMYTSKRWVHYHGD